CDRWSSTVPASGLIASSALAVVRVTQRAQIRVVVAVRPERAAAVAVVDVGRRRAARIAVGMLGQERVAGGLPPGVVAALACAGAPLVVEARSRLAVLKAEPSARQVRTARRPRARGQRPGAAQRIARRRQSRQTSTAGRTTGQSN